MNGQVRPPSQQAANAKQPALRTKTVARYVQQLGHTEPAALARFLDPRLSQLTPPSEMADRSLAAERIVRAIRADERIVVFGDYDCDGMTSTAILSDVIEELGGRVFPLLASRFDGGYGVSARALERIKEQQPRLVVTCDCGSSDHRTLEKLTQAGVDVIVIDHHLVPDEPLPVLAFLNPHRPECGFPYKGLASCGLVLSVAAELRKLMDSKLDVRRWLDLVAVGTIADVAPLTQDNRALVRAGLGTLRESPRPGLRALCDLIGIDRSYPLTASDVAFRVAPRLNAPGRLEAPDKAFLLMREKDPERAHALAVEVEHLCQTRRAEQARIEEEAMAEVAALEQERASAIVVGREGWNHGIVGIVAGRLAETHEKPALVIGFHDGVGRGSVRGPAGFPLFDCLAASQAHLVRFGGHQAAAGMELRIESLEEFRAAFIQACAERADFERPAGKQAMEVEASDDPSDLLHDLHLLEPCGEKNPAPELSFRCLIRSSRSLKGGHLKLDLEFPGRRRVSGFGPGLADSVGDVSGPAVISGQLRQDTYRGGEAVEILVRQVVCEKPAS